MWREAETALMNDVFCDNNHCLNTVAATFTDDDGEFSADFIDMLDRLTPQNSEKDLCIEDSLIKSERLWFERIRNAQLGLTTTPTSLVKWASTNWLPLKHKISTGYSAIEERDSNDMERGHPSLQMYQDSTVPVSKLQRSVEKS